VDLFLPEEIFPGPPATSSLKDVLLDPQVIYLQTGFCEFPNTGLSVLDVVSDRRRKCVGRYEGFPNLRAEKYSSKKVKTDDFFLLKTQRMGKIHKQEKGRKNKNRGERQKNSENQVTLDNIFVASKKHYLSNFVVYML
jgi:hypothetical protein